MAGGWAAIRAQQPAAAAKDPNAEAGEKIIAEVHDHNEIMSNLEYLSDMIGARLTGSENLKKANDWTRQKFSDYGVANPHLESWTVAHTWERGAASGRIVSPSVHPLEIASYAWAPSTNGAVHGRVVYVKAQSVDDLAQYKGKLKGAIVISAEPALLPPSGQPAPNPVTIPYGDSIVLVAPHRPGAPMAPSPGFREFIRARTEFFKNEGVLATLTDSGKPDGLLNMTGLGGRNYDIAPIPAAFVSSES
jgi:carboxypeptidase Q